MENVHILVNTPSMEYFNRCSCFVSFTKEELICAVNAPTQCLLALANAYARALAIGDTD